MTSEVVTHGGPTLPLSNVVKTTFNGSVSGLCFTENFELFSVVVYTPVND